MVFRLMCQMDISDFHATQSESTRKKVEDWDICIGDYVATPQGGLRYVGRIKDGRPMTAKEKWTFFFDIYHEVSLPAYLY